MVRRFLHYGDFNCKSLFPLSFLSFVEMRRYNLHSLILGIRHSLFLNTLVVSKYTFIGGESGEIRVRSDENRKERQCNEVVGRKIMNDSLLSFLLSI